MKSTARATSFSCGFCLLFIRFTHLSFECSSRGQETKARPSFSRIACPSQAYKRVVDQKQCI
jgi:hypothetical protein